MQNAYQQEESFSFWKKLSLTLVFFTITPIALFSSVVGLVAITNSSTQQEGLPALTAVETSISGAQVFASLPSDFPSISGEVLGADARSDLIKQYLKLHYSPLEPYAYYIVEASDKYGLDFRLTTAIAQKESNLGKKMPSDDCNNAWGYGIHSEGTLCFETWEQGIETVSRGLKENYIDEGFLTPEEIMSRYTPLSSGSWASGVLQFMEEMK